MKKKFVTSRLRQGFFLWQHSLDNQTSGHPRRPVMDCDRVPVYSSIDLSIRNIHSFWIVGFFFKVHLTRVIVNAIHIGATHQFENKHVKN